MRFLGDQKADTKRAYMSVDPAIRAANDANVVSALNNLAGNMEKQIGQPLPTPSTPTAQEVQKQVLAWAATSANSNGLPAPTTAKDALLAAQMSRNS